MKTQADVGRFSKFSGEHRNQGFKKSVLNKYLLKACNVSSFILESFEGDTAVSKTEKILPS